jgi:hypothetical protein
MSPVRPRIGVLIILIGALLALAAATTPREAPVGHVTPVTTAEPAR